jgi:phospholipid/cholesterol/gamma-HCH transport system ATP-binding protein
VIEVIELSVGIKDQVILGPISAQFEEGVSLVTGRIQSGKSTLLKAICGLINPFTGKVVVDGLDMARNNAWQITRNYFGYVFQNDALFDSMNALANVSLPLLKRGKSRGEAEMLAGQVLKEVGLEGHEKRMPEQFSGGMRKRLGLARAMVANPRYLLADEPFAGLDFFTAEGLGELLINLWNNKGGLVIATSNPDYWWSRCNQVVVLEQGKIVASGAPDAVRQY